MANEEQLAILKQGVDVWNKWREENSKEHIELGGTDLPHLTLQGANLRGANFRRAVLTGADLFGANLSRANLSRANLIGARLSEANLIKAYLRGANLSEANLREAALRNAELSEAILLRADLDEADLSEANLRGANLTKANLRGVYVLGADLRKADLSWADLSLADLRNADLSWADLSVADLIEATLGGANLREANLTKANLSGANLREANLSRTKLIGAELSGADLNHASLIETNLSSAVLTGCKVYGISAWNLRLEGAEQSNLVITRHEESTVMVDNLEVAQFIYLMLNRKKLRDVLSAMTQKGVLILGRFGDGGLEVLQAVAERIRKMGYLPMLFDFEASESRDFTETVKIMVGLARFVIADLSGPSVLKELEATVPDFEVPFIPIIEKGRPSPSMTIDLAKYGWFRWPPVVFDSKETLIEILPEEVITPAEEIGKRREQRRAKLFPNTDG